MDFNKEEIAVRATNDDSAESKYSASRVGYFKDKFLIYFVGQRVKRREPLIHRGYFARVEGFSSILKKFIRARQSLDIPLQIISIGAGFDTMYFRLKTDHFLDNVVYFELDFEDVVSKKSRTIRKYKELRDIAGDEIADGNIESEYEEHGFKSRDLRILGCDLRDFRDCLAKLEQEGISRAIPTLILAECVLVYLDPPHGDGVISGFRKFFAESCFVSYDAIHKGDAYGDMMAENFMKRGIRLQSFKRFPTLESVKERFLDLGYTFVSVIDMRDFYSQIDELLRMKIEKLEPLDEYEEWNLMLSHYVVVVARDDSIYGFI